MMKLSYFRTLLHYSYFAFFYFSLAFFTVIAGELEETDPITNYTPPLHQEARSPANENDSCKQALIHMGRNEIELAIECFKNAIHTGNTLAEVELASMYMKGRIQGNPVTNDIKAANLLTTAARKGNIIAQRRLGKMLMKNRVFSHNLTCENDEPWDNDELAVYWLDKAVKQKDPKSHYSLGCIFMDGRGGLGSCPISFYKAHSLFEVAAENGIPKANLMRGLMFMRGWVYSRDSNDDRSAIQCLTQALNKGVRDAATLLAFMTFKGRGTMENHLKALQLYMLSPMDPKLYTSSFLYASPNDIYQEDLFDFLSPLIERLTVLEEKKSEQENFLLPEESLSSMKLILSLFKEASPGLMLAHVHPSDKVQQAVSWQNDNSFLSLDIIDGISYLTLGQTNVKLIKRLVNFREHLKGSDCLTSEASTLINSFCSAIVRDAHRRDIQFLEAYPLKPLQTAYRQRKFSFGKVLCCSN